MSQTMTSLIGKTVKINIKEKEGYTSDLYSSIQGTTGKVIKKHDIAWVYNDGWLVEFDNKTTQKYAKTHSGKWSGMAKCKNMRWWTESKDFV